MNKKKNASSTTVSNPVYGNMRWAVRLLIPSYAARADGSIATIAVVIGSKVPLRSSHSVNILETVELYISLRFVLGGGVGAAIATCIDDVDGGEGVSPISWRNCPGLLFKNRSRIRSNSDISREVGVVGFFLPRVSRVVRSDAFSVAL